MIVIIGAGIAGLSLGWELLKAGQNVTIVEAGTIARGASGAATSYLEPRLGQTAMRKLEWACQRHWPQWAAEIEAESGQHVDFQNHDQIKVTNLEYLDAFEADLKLRDEQNWAYERLTAEKIRDLEPELGTEIVAGIFLREICWVDSLKLCTALASAICRDRKKEGGAQGQVLSHWPVTSISRRGEQIVVINRNNAQIIADQVVMATGGEGNSISGLPDDIPSTKTVRGVNLVLNMSDLKQPLRHLIKHKHGNLCPRAQNQLLVGTTAEMYETSPLVSDETIEKLYANAAMIFPKVRQLPLIKTTCGFRSKIGDGNLRLGRSRQLPKLAYSLSHSGAGFLRAPVVAREFASFLSGNGVGPYTKFILSS